MVFILPILPAYGTFLGLRTAVQFQLNQEDLRGIRVAVQGVDNVGFHLARLLTDAGAELFVADIHEKRASRTAPLCAPDFTVTPARLIR